MSKMVMREWKLYFLELVSLKVKMGASKKNFVSFLKMEVRINIMGYTYFCIKILINLDCAR